MADGYQNTPPPVSVAEHRLRALNAVRALTPVSQEISTALGRVLATEIVARENVPNFDNSAMDGYAVRRADTAGASSTHPVTLRVVADLPAGSGEDPGLAEGEVARIMTGAPVPADADSIVPVEDTDGGTDTVQIYATPAASAHIRPSGTDVAPGDLIVPAGKTLTSRDLAAAIAGGEHSLEVYPAPRVGVLSTGTELKVAGTPLERGHIHDSNSTLLAAAVTECGGIPVQLGSVPDDPEVLRRTLEEAVGRVDAFVTSGGVSVGAYDVVKEVLAPRGIWFGPVRMQPGKPQGFGAWIDEAGKETPIFALPGNPVSVFVSFEAFVRPALLAMQGHTQLDRPVHRAVATEGWRCPTGRRQQYMPATVEQTESGYTVRPASSGGSGSYLVASLARANALATVSEETTEVRTGDTVTVTLME